MKTYSLLALLAASVAFFVAPLSLEIAGSLLSLAGLGCVLVGDYSRPNRKLRRALAPVVHLERPTPRLAPVFELAA